MLATRLLLSNPPLGVTGYVCITTSSTSVIHGMRKDLRPAPINLSATNELASNLWVYAAKVVSSLTDMTKPSNTCDTCWNGIAANQFGLLGSPVNQLDDLGLNTHGYQYKISGKTIKSNADQGCHWCQLLSHCASRSDLESDKIFDIRAGRSNEVNVFDVYMNDRLVWFGYVYARQGDPAAAYVPGRNLFCDVGSESALLLAKGLMSNCLQHHNKCQQPPDPSPILPTRVIDCSDPSKPHLFVSSGARDRFIALSYVWGERQPHKMTKANLDSYIQSIDITLQPQTIRDAIMTTHNFGLRYLWIDSLCIIQDEDKKNEDDKSDKDHEMERMRSYYADSYLTIVAASASRVSQGFLQMRQDEFDKYSVTVPFLIFASHTLQYRCLTETRNIANADNAHWVSSEREPVPNRDLPKLPKTREEKEMIRKAWGATIENYTKRTVSRPPDKLTALAALAEEFHGIIQSPYLAGLWESELSELLWWKDQQHYYHPRPKEYRAPSWSWAAVDGEVSPGNAYILTDKQEFVADVVRAQTTPKNAKLSFGEITAGTIALSAKVEFECVMAPHWTIYRLRKPDEVVRDGEPIDEKTGRRMEEIGLGRLDSSDEDIQSGRRSVSIVLIYRRDDLLDPDIGGIQGIVVEPVTSEGIASDGKKYRRIGFFEREDKLNDVDEWLNNLAKVEIEIV